MKAQLLFPPLIDASVLWLASIGQVTLGVHLQKGWCLHLGAKTIFLSSPADMMPLLPLLEVGRVQFFDHLTRVGQWRSEYASAIPAFPEILLLRFAFESSVSEYWPSKAIDWLDGEPMLARELRESLRALLSQGWLPQRLRQRAQVVLKHSEQD
ncbi:hypothetical protein [Burkholderia ubonensis]|uniref:hypothetical protein n=1 Tax=Burkholderia ubonensis TaxID=101571 RepID=UPI0009B4BA7A|nr:hypothetical protein [Burkholderia ubonensis]